MKRGLSRPPALVAATPPFALFAYLVIADEGSALIQGLLLLSALVLALRAFGLRRLGGEASTQGGAIRLVTEFEGPEDDR